MWKMLQSVNRRKTDTFCIRMDSLTLGANSFDRLVYLVLHKLRVMGKRESTFFKNQIHAGMTVVDVGANIGFYTLQFARMVGPKGLIFAFEPDPQLFAQLDANIRRNKIKNATIFPLAAGSSLEHRRLHQDPLNSGNNCLKKETSERIDKGFVTVSSLDSVLGEKKIDWIKIDVQGWEPEVFKGMSKIIDINPKIKICFEFWPTGLRDSGFDPEDFLFFLHNQGFKLIHLEQDLRLPPDRFKSLCTIRTFVDLLAVR